jgi:hypothetical protein
MKKRNINISIVIIVFLISIFFTINIVNAAKDKDFSKYKYGAKLETKSMMNKEKKSKIPKNKNRELSILDFSGDMPPVGDQGTQNSCTGWAQSYYKGYQEKKDMAWGNIMFSPSFIYNQINGGVDGGSYQSDGYNLMYNSGNCRLSTMPYNNSDWLTQPNSTQTNEASNFKAADWGFIYTNGYNAILSDSVEYYMENENDCFTVSMPCYDDFWSGDYNDDSGYLYGYHALCVVGFNSSTQKIKFINSWGAAYGSSGYGYISYQLWDKFVTNDMLRTYAMLDDDSDPLESPTPTKEPTATPTQEPPTEPPTPTINPTSTNSPTPTPTIKPVYKNKIIYNGARTVKKKGANGAGNQWEFWMKNETKTTLIKHLKINKKYPIHESKDEYLISTWDGCYLKFMEKDPPGAGKSDITAIKIKSLKYGKNIIYLTVYENSKNWTKWKVAVTRKKVQVN